MTRACTSKGSQNAFQKQITNAAAAPLTNKDRVIGTLVVVDKLGGAADFEQADLELLSGFANQAAAALENARLYAAERRRADQFRVIAEIGRRLTLILDLDELLKQVVTVIQESFGYYHVAIGLVEGDEVIYKYGAGKLWGQPDFHLVPSRLKVGKEGVSGWVAGNGVPLNVPDVSKDPRYIHIEGSAGRSELIVPIIVKDKVIGTLDALSDRLNAFDEMDLMVMQSLAFQVGAAIDNARLYQKSQQAAVMEERSRLARELHDAVTQTLFSASLIAEAVPSVWEKDPQQGRELLQELRGLSRGASGGNAHAAPGAAPGSAGGNPAGRPARPAWRSRQRARGYSGEGCHRRGMRFAAHGTCYLVSNYPGSVKQRSQACPRQPGGNPFVLPRLRARITTGK